MPEINDMLSVVDADYIKDYELLLTFNDRAKRYVDLQPYLTGEVFGELKDKTKFIQHGLTRHTIEWANGADLALLRSFFTKSVRRSFLLNSLLFKNISCFCNYRIKKFISITKIN